MYTVQRMYKRCDTVYDMEEFDVQSIAHQCTRQLNKYFVGEILTKYCR